MNTIKEIILILTVSFAVLKGSAEDNIIIKPPYTIEEKILSADVIVKGNVASISIRLFNDKIVRDMIIIEYVLKVEKAIIPDQDVPKEVIVMCQISLESYNDLHSDITSEGYYLLRKSILFENPRYSIYEPWGIGGALSKGDSYISSDEEININSIIQKRRKMKGSVS